MGKEKKYENMEERIRNLHRTMRDEEELKIDRMKLKQISEEIDKLIERWIDKKS